MSSLDAATLNRPDAETLTRLHDAQIARFGGSPGIRDYSLLESAVGRVDTAISYVDLDTVDAASMLSHAVLKNHAFVDGNKRTAYGALVMTLAGNGLRLEADNHDIAERILEAAGSQDDYEALSSWVREHAVPDDTYRILHENDKRPKDPFKAKALEDGDFDDPGPEVA